MQFLDGVWLGPTDGGQGLRGWQGDWIEFRFPVVAIAGANGSGKSTVLKAAATAYRSPESAHVKGAQTFSPDDFFPTTPWETVQGVWLEFAIRRGDAPATRHKLSKPTKRWRGMPERPERPVYFLDVSRTQPIDTLIGYGRLARVELAERAGETHLSDNFRGILSRILHRKYDSGSVVKDEQGKQVGIVSRDGLTYSNYHQGAGEDATTDLIALLEGVPHYSLILIDEVEASLHPRSQRRLMIELIALAADRNLQIVVSTHSPYILEQLPIEARVFIQPQRDGTREIIYGVTPEYAMSMMDDYEHPELTLYCEDDIAVAMTDAIIRQSVHQDLLGRVAIIPVGPASTVTTLGALLSSRKMAAPGLGILDADQSVAPGCLRLPGAKAPEKEMFTALDDNHWAAIAERLGVRLGQLLDAKDDAMQLPDHHTWIRRTAEGLGDRLRSSQVQDAIIDVWVRDVLDDVDRDNFAADISSALAAEAR
ncbi:ATP-dependent nuclease [Modestobacter versicolor]|uniref:ATP-dependent nuclease n=1 Tax=Modestobacter versicolor TaxID=429133 RepID=UPI0015E8B08F|nr:ATP-binding protein [Modestobacter versicolor]